MTTVIETIQELFQYVVVEWFGWRKRQLTLLQSAVEHTKTTGTKRSSSRAKPIPKIEVDISPNAYITLPEVKVYHLPTQTLDGVCCVLAYGTGVQATTRNGRWQYIESPSGSGWVLYDALTSDRVSLIPVFQTEHKYTADNSETIKLRKLQGDVFQAGQLDEPLQDIEFVEYYVSAAGYIINWSSARPRVAGQWQRVLKGQRGVHIGLSPKTQSVIEYADPTGVAHVAVITTVSPAETITICGVGLTAVGVYEVIEMKREEWIELHPVFITFT